VQLVLHYNGAGFAGWQRQPDQRTVQGELERVLHRLCDQPVPVQGAGRTDAGVHARGQAAGITVPHKWEPDALRRALNALLPRDVWVTAAHEMHPDFHARYRAVSRRYRYRIGTDDEARSPFRRPYEWALTGPLDVAAMHAGAVALHGRHAFRAFAVRGTAPDTDEHECTIHRAEFVERHGGAGLDFFIEADRFLHHMVRFLVGTLADIGRGRRPLVDVARLLAADDNSETSAPAPAHGLFLEHVEYPSALYISRA
jgi:tRNA pseudouridine38-40 synthase